MTAGFIKPDTPNMLQFTSSPLTIAIYCFGLLLCSYSYVVLSDMREHIERNWERADLARTGHWRKAHWGGRKLHGWLILLVFSAASGLAYLVLITMALVWS